MYSTNLDDVPLLASPQPHVGSSSLTTSQLTSLCLQRACSEPNLSINATEKRQRIVDNFQSELLPQSQVRRGPWPPTPPFPLDKLTSRKCSEESEVFLALTSEQELEIVRFLQGLDESDTRRRGISPHVKVADGAPFPASRVGKTLPSVLQTPRPPLPKGTMKSLSARSSPGLSDILTTASASEVSSANESSFENYAVRTYDSVLQKGGCIASPWCEKPIHPQAQGYQYWKEDELEDSCVPRLACRFCRRQFREDRVAIHQEICQRVAGSRKRHVSESRVQQTQLVKVATGSRVSSTRSVLPNFSTQPSHPSRSSSRPPSSFSEHTPKTRIHRNIGMHSNDWQVTTPCPNGPSVIKAVAANVQLATHASSARDHDLHNLRPAPELPKWMSNECDLSPAPAWWESKPTTEVVHASGHPLSTSAVSSSRKGCSQTKVHDHGMFGELMTEVAELNEQVDRMLSRRKQLF